MPELDVIAVPQCAQLSHAEFLIPSSDGHHTYFVTLTTTGRGDYITECGCPGSKYHGKCKHIKQAEEKQCTWHSQFGEEQKEDGVCPRCGGPVDYVRFAV